MMLKNSDEVKRFLREHKNPLVFNVTTIKDGYVSCIGPIPAICGAELHVNIKTRPELDKLIRTNNRG